MEYFVMISQDGYSCQFEMQKFIIFIYISETVIHHPGERWSEKCKAQAGKWIWTAMFILI